MRKPGAAGIDACRRPTSVWVALGRSPVSSPKPPLVPNKGDNVTINYIYIYTQCGSIQNINEKNKFYAFVYPIIFSLIIHSPNGVKITKQPQQISYSNYKTANVMERFQMKREIPSKQLRNCYHQ